MAIPLEIAQESDWAAIVVIMNAAFRGTQSQRSWSTEAEYITGVRTSEPLLREEIAGGARYLVAKAEGAAVLRGCVSVKAISPQKWYLGSLTVDPALQNSGFGRELLLAAEEYIEKNGASMIEITVIQVREALMAWYERRGYRRTGETRPFPYGDDRFGSPTRNDLGFVVLVKQLGQ